ncbi:Modification methylase MboII [Phycisphaerales bacterium]|nr:Modification methylase MboII [Phycisphaerales bacterium]
MIELDIIRTVEAREGLAGLPDQSVDCVLTSPPYWACRDYGVAPAQWEDGSSSALGLEPDFEKYLDHLIEIFNGIKRVLKDEGTLWVNLGDVYASGTRARWRGPLSHHLPNTATGTLDTANPPEKRKRAHGLEFHRFPDKTLCMIPERFALRMLQKGWILRNRIAWVKPNFLPASVGDRFACSWEYLFLFSKSERYFFDIDAVRVPHSAPERAGAGWESRTHSPRPVVAGTRLPPRPGEPDTLHRPGKNPGDCWSIPTRGTQFPHPAIFPEALCERPISAGCPVGGIVLDPFAGSGTACVVAKRLGRRYLGFEVNPIFADYARQRLQNTPTAAPIPAPPSSPSDVPQTTSDREAA